MKEATRLWKAFEKRQREFNKALGDVQGLLISEADIELGFTEVGGEGLCFFWVEHDEDGHFIPLLEGIKHLQKGGRIDMDFINEIVWGKNKTITN